MTITQEIQAVFPQKFVRLYGTIEEHKAAHEVVDFTDERNAFDDKGVHAMVKSIELLMDISEDVDIEMINASDFVNDCEVLVTLRNGRYYFVDIDKMFFASFDVMFDHYKEAVRNGGGEYDHYGAKADEAVDDTSM